MRSGHDAFLAWVRPALRCAGGDAICRIGRRAVNRPPTLRDSMPPPRPAARSRTETGHRARRSRTLLHDRIEGDGPTVLARVVHHDIDEHGHEEGQDGGAITHLIPVDPAVPGRAAVDDLVAKDVEPVEHEAQDLDGIPRPQGSRESTLRGP